MEFVLSLALGLLLKRAAAIVSLAIIVVSIFLASVILPMIFYVAALHIEIQ